MSDDLPTSARTVRQTLWQLGAGGEIVRLPQDVRTASAAAEAVGCAVGAIANSLIFLADQQPLLVMASGGNRVHEPTVAKQAGFDAITRATPEQVRAATGQAIGGVAPVGHPTALETVIDEALELHPVLWAAGGTPDTLFRTTLDELVRLTGGRVLRVR